MRSYLGLFFIAALFSLLVTPAVRTLGHWLQAYGQADDGREQPHIPRLGGLGILVAALAAWGVLLFVPNDGVARFLLACGCLAFLIFLGDTGSLFLGFVLATLAIHTSQKSSTLLAIVVPFAAFGLPVFDTSLTVVRRFLSGRPLFVGDHDHIHHRLLQRLSPPAAALVLYALTALFSLGSLLIIHSTGNLVALVAVLAGVSGWFLTSRLHYEELSELNAHVSQALHSQRRVLANQILIRKVSGQLKEPQDLEESWQVLVKALEALEMDTKHQTTPARPSLSRSSGGRSTAPHLSYGRRVSKECRVFD